MANDNGKPSTGADTGVGWRIGDVKTLPSIDFMILAPTTEEIRPDSEVIQDIEQILSENGCKGVLLCGKDAEYCYHISRLLLDRGILAVVITGFPLDLGNRKK